jgi:mannose-6-phosphate isomerase
VKPLPLPPNQLHHFYRGGDAIARFRGTPATDDHAPEDWVGSTATMFGSEERGMSRLADGRLLRDAIEADPDAFLGPAHTARFGPDTALLVKLLDAGQRLPAHFHPDAAFAGSHLGLAHGKTEAWLIVETPDDGAPIWLGFCHDVEADELAAWVARQEVDAMLGALNEIPVAAGDCVFVPAGFPHAIGEGIFLVELQEPTDLSILMEWTGFAIDGKRDGHLGLGFEVALQSARRTAVNGDELAGLRRRASSAPESAPGRRNLLPASADGFFRAERLSPAPTVTLEPAFSILVVVDGDGELETEDGNATVARGDTLLIPHAAGAAELRGPVDAIRCLPPDPEAAS